MPVELELGPVEVLAVVSAAAAVVAAAEFDPNRQCWNCRSVADQSLVEPVPVPELGSVRGLEFVSVLVLVSAPELDFVVEPVLAEFVDYFALRIVAAAVERPLAEDSAD